MSNGTTVNRGSAPQVESQVEQPGPALAPRRVHRRARRILTWVAVALLVAVVLAAGVAAGERINQPLGATTLHSGLAASSEVVGDPPSLPWPAGGQGAISIPAIGYAAQSGPENPVPIASLTKLTTAVVVLHDHPIAAGDRRSADHRHAG